jgi:hypothetical protein
MSKFTFTDPKTNRTYSVNAPTGVSQEQVQAMFNQQLDGGSLAGVDIGGTLSAATQAAAGLASAQAILSQNLGAIAGKLPIGAALNTITSSLGPGGLAGASQLASSLLGQSFPLATNAVVPGLNTATAALGLPGIASAAQLVAQSGTALTTQGLVGSAVKTITGSLAGVVTNGINVADLVKQGTAPALPDLSSVNVQAAMTSAAKLVGQPRTVVSDSLGVGKFGFDLPQLEKAGFIKPGTTAIAGTVASLTSVLSSPTVFTGKDGVKNLDGILGNAGLQDKIQTSLMATGLNELKAVGVSVDQFNPQAIAGLANNAAKSVTNTLTNLQGKATAALKATFDSVTRDSAFAVNFADTKVEPEVLGEVTAEPAENTVDTVVLDAAEKRVVGNAKVPNPVSDLA